MIPHLAFPAIDWRTLEAELARELQHRRRFYPGRVAKGNMLQADADRELAIAAAWAEDLARIRDCWFRRPGSGPAPTPHHIPWLARRNALLRELDMRTRFYPQWIASGRLLETAAAHQVDCLKCLLAIYEDGWDWRGSDGQIPSTSPTAAREYRELRNEIDAREGRSQQEMVLN